MAGLGGAGLCPGCPPAAGPAGLLARSGNLALLGAPSRAWPPPMLIASLRCDRHQGYRRLADMPPALLDEVRMLRGIVSHYYRDQQVTAEFSVEDCWLTTSGPAHATLWCLPRALPSEWLAGMVPSEWLAGVVPSEPAGVAPREPAGVPPRERRAGAPRPLPGDVFDLGREAGPGPYLYIERRPAGDGDAPGPAQLATWQGWLVLPGPGAEPAASPTALLTAALCPTTQGHTTQGHGFPGWLLAAGRYRVAAGAGVPVIDIPASIRSSTTAGNDAVASGFRTTWAGEVQEESVARFAAALRPRPGGVTRVLDAGCGPAPYYPAMSRLGLRWVGADASRNMLREARALLGAPAADGHRPALVQADLLAPPFRDGAFSGIWLRAVMVHISHGEAPRLLRACHAMLAPGGVLYLNYQVGRGVVVRPEGRVFFYYTEEEVAGMCAAAGFTVVDAWDGSSSRSTSGSGHLKIWRHLVFRRAPGR
jgi:SAM-dependent methyltransferase